MFLSAWLSLFPVWQWFLHRRFTLRPLPLLRLLPESLVLPLPGYSCPPRPFRSLPLFLSAFFPATVVVIIVGPPSSKAGLFLSLLQSAGNRCLRWCWHTVVSLALSNRRWRPGVLCVRVFCFFNRHCYYYFQGIVARPKHFGKVFAYSRLVIRRLLNYAFQWKVGIGPIAFPELFV